jgi:hypothetical protein
MPNSKKKELARLSAHAFRKAVQSLRAAERFEKTAAKTKSVVKKKSLKDAAEVCRYFHDVWLEVEKMGWLPESRRRKLGTSTLRTFLAR